MYLGSSKTVFEFLKIYNSSLGLFALFCNEFGFYYSSPGYLELTFVYLHEGETSSYTKYIISCIWVSVQETGSAGRTCQGQVDTGASFE